MTAVSTLSESRVVLIVVVAMAAVFLLILGNSLRQSRKHAATPAGPSGAEAATRTTPKPISRRDFFRAGMLVSLGAFVAEFGGASLAFLWPNLKGGFGSVIEAGTLDDINGFIAANHQPYYFGAGRFYLVPYKVNPVPEIYGSQGLVQGGLMALYQKCVHLGCRVPFCQTSQWFECPCHGSKYNEAGEYQLGPAPTGLNRFKITISGGKVMVDTSNPISGPPRGTNTTNQTPEGPFCV